MDEDNENEVNFDYVIKKNKAEALGLMVTLAKESRSYYNSNFGALIEGFGSSVLHDFYLIQELGGLACGFVTFAKLNESTKNTLLKKLRSLAPEEFNSGKAIVILEVVAIHGDGTALISKLRAGFPDDAEVWGINPNRRGASPEFPAEVFPIDKDFNYKKYLRK